MQIKLQGAKELQAKLSKRPQLLASKVRPIVKNNAAQLKDKTVANMTAAYTAGYSTGEAGIRGTVDTVFSNAGMTATVAPHKEYFPYLEYGTRFMSARPTLHPAFAYQSVKFINQLKAVMK